MSNLPAKQGQQFDLTTYVDRTIRPNVMKLLPQESDWPAFQVAILAMVADKPALRNAIAGNPESALVAVLKCARLGLSLNPIDKHFALVPRGGAVQGEPQYQGWVHLAMQSGAIEWIHAEVIYRQEVDGLVGPLVDPLDRHVNHSANELQRDSYKDSDILAAYCSIKLKGQKRLETRVMPRGEIDKRRAKGAANSEAWRDHFPAMCKAKVFKATCSSPTVPRSKLMADALMLFRESDDMDPPAGPAAPPAPNPRTVPPPARSGQQVMFEETDKEPFPADPDLAARLRSCIEIESQGHPPEKVAELFSKVLGRPFTTAAEVTDTDELQRMFDALGTRTRE